jgi:alkylated DNA nucleotide flippase Atl1
VDEAYQDLVRAVVAGVPRGRAMTYGLIAEVVADRLAATGGRVRGGPRQVGQVLARSGADLPWWRVVNASGRPPAAHTDEALARLRAEGTPLTRDGRAVALRRAVWWPDEPDHPTDRPQM